MRAHPKSTQDYRHSGSGIQHNDNRHRKYRYDAGYHNYGRHGQRHNVRRYHPYNNSGQPNNKSTSNLQNHHSNGQHNDNHHRKYHSTDSGIHTHSVGAPSNHEVTGKHTTEGRQFKNSASSGQPPSTNLAWTNKYRFPDVNTFYDIGKLLHEAYVNIGHLSNSTIAAIWYRIAALLVQQQHHPSNVLVQTKQLSRIIQRTMESIKQFRPRDLSTTILGIAKILKCVREAKGKGKDGAYHNMFALALGVDKLTSSDGIFRCLAKAANDILPQFDQRCIANLVYAYALLGYNPRFNGGSTLFENAAHVAIRKLHGFNSQNLANTVWSFATLEMPHADLFGCIGDHIASMSHKDMCLFKPQEFANIVWAYATSSEQHPELFKKIGDVIVSRDLSSFNSQDFANIVWAYATSSEQHPELFKKIGDVIVSRDLSSFNSQDLSNIVWAYATSSEQHPELFKKIGDVMIVSRDLSSFNSQSLSNIVWAYATSSEQHPELFKTIGDVIVSRDLSSFNSQDLANIVWAYATENEIHPELFHKVADVIEGSKLLRSFNAQNLANIAWAFTVAKIDVLLFNGTFTQVLREKQAGFMKKHLCQLYQWHLWQAKELLMPHPGLPKSMIDRCYQAFANGDEIVSELQRDVMVSLKAIGLNPKQEFLTQSGYSIDALVEIRGENIGIEVDGPSHFIGQKPKGHTLLKRRQVAGIDGIPIVSVPYWEWNRLGEDEGKKKKYLETLLDFDWTQSTICH
jgi:hypothetical protein